MVRRLREAGAIVIGLTLLPELAICGFTESATYGVTRNPWNPQRSPGGSSGGSRRRGGGGDGPDRLGRRRRRLDPPAGRFLRPLRAEAAARARLACARSTRAGTASPSLGCLSRTVAGHGAVAGHRRGRLDRARRAVAPERPFVESAKTAPGKLRVAYSTLAPRAAAPPTVDRCRQGRRRRRRRADALARPRGGGARPRLGRDRQQHHRRGSCAASPRPSTKCPTPSASKAAPAASAASAADSPTSSSSAPCAAATSTPPASTPSSTPTTC